jgi:hypothetical protein
MLQEAFVNIRLRVSKYKPIIQRRQKIITFYDGRGARALYGMEFFQFWEAAP